jgi:hypothetical protein
MIPAVVNNQVKAESLQYQEKKKIEITADEKKDITHRGKLIVISLWSSVAGSNQYNNTCV